MTDEEIIFPAFGNVVKNPFRGENFVKESYDGYRAYPLERHHKTNHYGLIIAVVLVILMQLL